MCILAMLWTRYTVKYIIPKDSDYIPNLSLSQSVSEVVADREPTSSASRSPAFWPILESAADASFAGSARPGGLSASVEKGAEEKEKEEAEAAVVGEGEAVGVEEKTVVLERLA